LVPREKKVNGGPEKSKEGDEEKKAVIANRKGCRGCEESKQAAAEAKQLRCIGKKRHGKLLYLRRKSRGNAGLRVDNIAMQKGEGLKKRSSIWLLGGGKERKGAG